MRGPPFGQSGAGVWEGAFEDLQGRDPPGPADGGEDAAPRGDAAFLFAGVEEHERGVRHLAHHGQGGGVRVVESFKVAEQNLIAQARQLVGDRDPREHNLTAQVRALDAAKTGAGLGLPILLALASAMLQRSIRGGLIAVGNLSLGGGVETVLNAAQLAEHAMEKGATALLLPVSARRQLLDVSDEVATKVSFIFYSDAQDALVKALDE